MNQQIMKLEGSQICVICDASEKENPELGTGFVFLKPDWIVTAEHVVIDQGLPRNSLYVKFADPNLTKRYRVKIVSIHKENDLAILELTNESSPCQKPLFPGYDDLSVSRGIVCMGLTPTKGKSILTASLAHLYDKYIRERERNEIILEFESEDIEGGCSGGPIFGDGGVVLAVMINVFSTESNPSKKMVRATSIRNLMAGITFDFSQHIFTKI